jgi:hypothetical protein
MTLDQILIIAILGATVLLFLWGGWRHDMVALAALLACVLAGLVPSPAAFAGFAHPAVITVACVLVLSQGLVRTGAVDALTRAVLPRQAGPTLSIAVLAGLAAALSGVMNNVGALALLMPVAIQVARRLQLPPGRVLMPLAFSSILGGMTTLIGTPTNLIVSGFRASHGHAGFAMFDFTPVGLAVATVGVLFVRSKGYFDEANLVRPGGRGRRCPSRRSGPRAGRRPLPAIQRRQLRPFARPRFLPFPGRQAPEEHEEGRAPERQGLWRRRLRDRHGRAADRPGHHLAERRLRLRRHARHAERLLPDHADLSPPSTRWATAMPSLAWWAWPRAAR